MFNFVNLC